MSKGILVTSLTQIHGPSGKVMHMLKSTDPAFETFGEIYFSTVYPGVVKAWHKHTIKTVNLTVVHGLVRFVTYSPDERLEQHFIGPENYKLITIPPGIWYGFQGIGQETAIIADCATHPFNESEQLTLDSHSENIPFAWGG
jgi:dTDP-4-dehydrorhamnose 3,5-epimerase